MKCVRTEYASQDYDTQLSTKTRRQARRDRVQKLVEIRKLNYGHYKALRHIHFRLNRGDLT